MSQHGHGIRFTRPIFLLRSVEFISWFNPIN